jgi:hypothetical protein
VAPIVSPLPEVTVSAHALAVIEPASRVAWRHAAADLDALPRSVPAARHLVGLVVRSWGLKDTAISAELITSELVTNAVAASAAAGHPVIRLRLTRRAWSLLIQVWDASPGLPEPGGGLRMRSAGGAWSWSRPSRTRGAATRPTGAASSSTPRSAGELE